METNMNKAKRNRSRRTKTRARWWVMDVPTKNHDTRRRRVAIVGGRYYDQGKGRWKDVPIVLEIPR
jgi:hypothetical protein